MHLAKICLKLSGLALVLFGKNQMGFRIFLKRRCLFKNSGMTKEAAGGKQKRAGSGAFRVKGKKSLGIVGKNFFDHMAIYGKRRTNIAGKRSESWNAVFRKRSSKSSAIRGSGFLQAVPLMKASLNLSGVMRFVSSRRFFYFVKRMLSEKQGWKQ